MGRRRRPEPPTRSRSPSRARGATSARSPIGCGPRRGGYRLRRRAGRARRGALRPRLRGGPRAARRRPRGRGVADAATQALALWRGPVARRARLRGVRAGRGPAPGGAARAGARGARRGRPRARRARAASPASSRRWSPSTRCASACAASRCSRSTGSAATPTRSPPTATCATRLDDELGLEPGPRAARARAGDPHPPAARPRGDALPGPPTPTVGREEDLRRIGDAARSATTSACSRSPAPAASARRGSRSRSRARPTRASSRSPRSATPSRSRAAICDALDVTRVPGEPAEDALHRALAGERRRDRARQPRAPPRRRGGRRAACSSARRALTVLGTSRQPLGLQAEHRFPVAPLAEAGRGAAVREPRRARAGSRSPTTTGPRSTDICRAPRRASRWRSSSPPARLGVLDPAGPRRAPERRALAARPRPGRRARPPAHAARHARLELRAARASAERDAFTALGAFAGGCDARRRRGRHRRARCPCSTRSSTRAS